MSNPPTTRPRRTSFLPKAFSPISAANGITTNPRRRISLSFLRPSNLRGSSQGDQRSFLSLTEEREDEYGAEGSDGSDSGSSFRSLPSTLEGTDDEVETISRWLDEERERRSVTSSRANSFTEGDALLREADRIFSHRNSYATMVESNVELEEEEEESDEEDFANEKATKSSEAKKLGRYSAPLILNFILEQVFSLVCIVFAGHLGKAKLAAVSIATMVSSIVLAIYEGIATALDTLCPQAYGAGRYDMVGIQTQRCAVFSLVLFVPAAISWWYSSSFLKYMIEDPNVVTFAEKFLRVMIIGGPPYILFEDFKRYLQAQGIFDAATLILFITAPLDILLNWILVYSPNIGLGYLGTAWASVINLWLTFILLVLYIIFVDGYECWDGFSVEAFTHWKDMSMLAGPGIIMLLAESMAYELLTLMASYLGTNELAAQTALSSVVSLLYMIPFAFSVAASTRIANFVGSGNINSSKVATHVGMMSCVYSALLNGFIILVFARPIAWLFTSDPDVQQRIVSLCPLMSLFVILDGWGCVASGVLRALGLQGIGGVINLVGYYLIAVPLAIVLGFTCQLGLEGLWIGNAIGLLLIAVGETYVIQTADWNDIIKQANARNKNDD